MTPRERYIQTVTFGQPDKIPFEPGWPRESTLANWHKQGLPQEANWWEYLHEQVGITLERAQPAIDLGVDFRMIPQFEEKVLEHRGNHYIVQDWKGNVCEISDSFDPSYLRTAKDFVTRRWLRCPVETRDDWEAMKQRFQMDSPGRLPDDFEDRCRRAIDRDWVLSLRFRGPFWQMREWCGFEGLCMMMVEQPDLVADMASFWTDFCARLIDMVLARVTPDSLFFSEDMAYKAKAMISPAMMREFCKPSWVRWASQAKAAGVPIVDVDSDGYIGEIIPIWIEAGVNCTNPMEVAAHNDIVEFRRQFGRQMAYYGGVDKRCMAKGGQALRDELKRIEPVVRDGGYIPGCDHSVPSDVSWPHFLDYSRQLAAMTCWI